jgi:hypothetical protein
MLGNIDKMNSIPQGYVLQPDGSYAKPMQKQGASIATAFRVADSITQPMARTVCVASESTDVLKLNKTERAWYRRVQQSHSFVRAQAITLKLGDDCRYTPDISGYDASGQEILWEVKGFMRDDALVKIKTAARMYPEKRFILVKKNKNEWDETPIKP